MLYNLLNWIVGLLYSSNIENYIKGWAEVFIEKVRAGICITIDIRLQKESWNTYDDLWDMLMKYISPKNDWFFLKAF